MSIPEMESDLNAESQWPSYEASALYGNGVKPTFKKICMMTVLDVCRQLL